MWARLWWKEARLLGPSWPLLVLVAAGLEWFAVAGAGFPRDPAGLFPLAMAWAILYAFAAGAAAFAGERESRTLGFLDALPVPRRALWAGKASFAIGSTLGLALALALVAAIGSIGWRPPRIPSGPPGWDVYAGIAREQGVLLVEAVAWSLFWSAVVRNPLAAGALGVGSVGSILAVTGLARDLFAYPHPGMTLVEPVEVVPRLILAGLALAGSALVVANPGVRWRSPIARPERSERVEPAGPAFWPFAFRDATAIRALAWQAWRRGRATMVLAAAATIAYTLLTGEGRLGTPGVAPGAAVVAAAACLVAGVEVFGGEVAGGSRRFLRHQGIGPGLAWATRVVVWATAIEVIVGAFLWLTIQADPPTLRPMATYAAGTSDPVPALAQERGASGALIFGSIPLDGFAIGLVAGMAIRRRITATLAGAIALILVAPTMAGLALESLIPAWTTWIPPLAILAASRCWAGDWLAERPGAWPRARLGAYLAAPAALLIAGLIAYRAYGEPWAEPAPPQRPNPPGPVLGPAYRKALAGLPPDWRADRLIDRIRNVLRGGGRRSANSLRDMEQDLARAAAFRAAEDLAAKAWALLTFEAEARPAGLGASIRALAGLARRVDVDPTTEVVEQVRGLAATPRARVDAGATDGGADLAAVVEMLLLGDARDRLGARRRIEPDPAGAWDSILAVLRFAAQLDAGPASPERASASASNKLRAGAVDLAFDWARAAGQRPDLIGRARADLAGLDGPRPIDAARALRAESRAIDRALESSAEELSGQLVPIGATFLQRLSFGLFAAPWERRRATMVARRYLAERADRARFEPWERPGRAGVVAEPWRSSFRGSPLAARLVPDAEAFQADVDLGVESWRALGVFLAAREWQLTHGGQPPPTLDALAGLPGGFRVPIDPYSGGPFGYATSEGVAMPGRPGAINVETPSGRRMIYSVGPDRVDNGGSMTSNSPGLQGDLIYALP